MSDKLDPALVLERLRRVLADFEREMQPSDWRMHFNVSVTYYPRDGGGGSIHVMVGTGHEEDDEDDE